MQQLKENDLSLTDEEILEIIGKYINNQETNYAILLDGEWGSGKTYFIRKKLVPKLKVNYEKERKEKKDRKPKRTVDQGKEDNI